MKLEFEETRIELVMFKEQDVITSSNTLADKDQLI